MNFLDLTLPSPEANLALDEALLDEAEAGRADETLRLWESSRTFVVVGYSRKVHEDVDLDACREAGIPVLRRASGGGTVLQGPGCLNFALILAVRTAPELRTIRGTNDWVLSRMVAALSAIAPDVRHRGISDLALGEKKFCGTAQRRKKSHLLFHGSLLTGLDLSLIERCLRMPPPKDEPDYRRHRTHLEFLTHFAAPAPAIRSAVAAAWGTKGSVASYPRSAVDSLIQERYSRPEWNFKY